MTHDVLIAVHAVAATAALGTGAVALVTGRLVALHLGLVVVMAVSLAGAVVAGWADLVPATRVVFAALVGLAAAMCVVATRAHRTRAGQGPGQPDGAHVDRVGFVLVSLTVGFVAIAVLRAGAPVPVVVAAAVGTVLVARALVHVVRRRMVGARSREAPTG